MITLPAIFQRIGENARGRIFLINLQYSLEAGLLNSSKLQRVLDKVLTEFSLTKAGAPDPGISLPDSEKIIDILGGHFIRDQLWRDSIEPNLSHYGRGRQILLSRIATYTAFYKLLNRFRTPTLGTITELRHAFLPSPLPPSAPGGEIALGNVNTVRDYIDSGMWREELEREGVDVFRMDFVWLTAHATLEERSAAAASTLADYYRDLVGLSHLCSGRHLVRFDIDLSLYKPQRGCSFRRPHGASNGGTRFRARYDGPDRHCGWGRTVDLSHVEKHSDLPVIDGVPELVACAFDPPLKAVSARYIGQITRDPEREDDYFISRLSADSLDAIIDCLCRELLPCH